jgi:hypothetical protein
VAWNQRNEAQRQEAIRQRDQAIALKLTSQGQAMLARAQAGGDVRAIQQILAAPAIASNTDKGALLTAVVERQTTIKIISTLAVVSSVALRPDGHRIAATLSVHPPGRPGRRRSCPRAGAQHRGKRVPTGRGEQRHVNCPTRVAGWGCAVRGINASTDASPRASMALLVLDSLALRAE